MRVVVRGEVVVVDDGERGSKTGIQWRGQELRWGRRVIGFHSFYVREILM